MSHVVCRQCRQRYALLHKSFAMEPFTDIRSVAASVTRQTVRSYIDGCVSARWFRSGDLADDLPPVVVNGARPSSPQGKWLGNTGRHGGGERGEAGAVGS